MNTDGNYVSQFKDTIEKIVDAEIEKKGTPKYVSAIIQNVNNDGTVDVYLPPDLTSVLKGILNKTGETLSNGDSVELCTKNGSVNNSWVAIKHKTNALFAGTNVPNTFTQDQTFNGSLNLFNYNKIYWKEPDYGDKFAIAPHFSGTDDDNFLAILGAVGGSGTNPDLEGLLTISGKSGHAWVKGNISSSHSIQAVDGFYSAGSGSVNTATNAGNILIKHALVSTDNTPQNGVVLEYGQSTLYKGQLLITDNANDGIWFNGWSNGTRGSWRKLAFEQNVQAKGVELYSNASGSNGDITLSDSAANYIYIEIFFRNNDNKYSSTKIYQPDGKSVSLMSQDNNSSSVWLKVTSVTISGTAITKGGACEVALKSDSSPTISSSNNNYITRVVGYK